VLLCFTAAAQKAPPAKPFDRLDGCILEPDEWTDGDSFRVRLLDSRLETFRLYFVDATESRSRGKRFGRASGLLRTNASTNNRPGQEGEDIHGKRSCRTVHDLHTLTEGLWTNSLLSNRCHGRRSSLQRVACQLRIGTNLRRSHTAAGRSELPQISRASARSEK
jgi:hypothetical protein